jgi:hypothetical protein
MSKAKPKLPVVAVPKSDVSQAEYLALDVSTSCTGIAAFDKHGELVGTRYFKPKVSVKDPNSSHFLVKARGLHEFLVAEFGASPIKNVWIEEPLENANNVKTVTLLCRFNGVVSQSCWNLFNCFPIYLSVYEWRRALCPEGLKPKPGKQGKNGEMSWSLPKGTDPKAYIYAKVRAWYPGLGDWTVKPDGTLAAETYDMSDAVGVGVAGLLQAGVIHPKTLSDRLHHTHRLTRTP